MTEEYEEWTEGQLKALYNDGYITKGEYNNAIRTKRNAEKKKKRSNSKKKRK